MKTITLRGIDEKLERLIKINSKEAKMSVNQWLLHTLKKVTEMENKVDLVEHKDWMNWLEAGLKKICSSLPITPQVLALSTRNSGNEKTSN